MYTLFPQIDGFWGEGGKYRDSAEIVRAVQNRNLDERSVSRILSDGVLSFFEEIRKRHNVAGNGIGITELKNIENAERQEGGKGVQRFLMLFAGGTDKRYFELDGFKYKSIYDFISKHKNNGAELRVACQYLLKNQSFQAWLWAKGMENAGREAVRIAENNPQQSMFTCL